VSGYLPVTNVTAWNFIIETMILNSSNAVATLYAKGGRAILTSAGEIPNSALTNLPPTSSWGLTPAEQALEQSYELRFQTGFYDAMRTFSQTKPDLRLISVDVLSKLYDVVANPSLFGVTKTEIDALDDTSLTNKSFTGPGADYMFWNSAHPTTKVHRQIAAWNVEALTNSVLEELGATLANGFASIRMNRLLIGRDYTLQTSSDLKAWNDVQTFTAAAGTNQWSGADSNSESGYFRLKWEK